MHDSRVNKLRNALISKNIDSLLISNFYNVLYLTGFKTLTTDERESFVLITRENTYLFSDERYLSKDPRPETRDPRLITKLIEPGKGLLVHIEEIIKTENIKSLGFESEDIRYFEFDSLKQKLPSVELIPTNRLVVEIREIKDQEEVGNIEQACKIVDQCLEEIKKIIRLGMSEKAIAVKIEFWLKEKGYDLAFDPIVAIDKNSSLPHYDTKSGSGIIKKGSIILVDFGAKYKDYLSDITRMFFYGKPEVEISNTYEILLKAQEATLEKLPSCNNLKDPDELCRKLMIDKGLPSYPHSTGHGVGLEIHEYPKVSFNSLDLKKVNQVFTVEPGVYFPNKWGMRIEDTVVVTENLKIKTLTNYPKSMQIIS